MRSLISTVVRFFLTGVATLLPMVVTVFVVSWAVKLADAYVGPSSTFGLFLLKIVGPDHKYPGYLAGYLVVVLLIILLGFLVTRATVAEFRRALDSMLSGIPLVGRIYKAVGQVVDIFGSKDQAALERFGGIAEVSIGSIRMVALLTSTETYVTQDGREHYLLFIPSSPIPATGFTMLVPVEDVRRLDMPVEELAKLMMSLGLLGPQVLKEPLGPASIQGDDENGR